MGAAFKNREPTGEVVSANAPGRDTIVSRILWLRGLDAGNQNAYDRYIYIHGTAEERNVGHPVSYGCIRMRSRDVIALYDEVGVGAKVFIRDATAGRGRRADAGAGGDHARRRVHRIESTRIPGPDRATKSRTAAPTSSRTTLGLRSFRQMPRRLHGDGELNDHALGSRPGGIGGKHLDLSGAGLARGCRASLSLRPVMVAVTSPGLLFFTLSARTESSPRHRRRDQRDTTTTSLRYTKLIDGNLGRVPAATLTVGHGKNGSLELPC